VRSPNCEFSSAKTRRRSDTVASASDEMCRLRGPWGTATSLGTTNYRTTGALRGSRTGDRVLNGKTRGRRQIQQGRCPLIGIGCGFAPRHLITAYRRRKVLATNTVQLEAFRAWQDSDASVRGTAEVLVCHPNTVRHRLRRIEKHTGRSLSRPRDVAELCSTSEVHRRLM
jgi:hypothetical protein